MHQFPETKFLVWTGAALVAEANDPESAQRAQAFFDWVNAKWDEPGDNITSGTSGSSRPREASTCWTNTRPTRRLPPQRSFAADGAPLFAQRIVDVSRAAATAAA